MVGWRVSDEELSVTTDTVTSGSGHICLPVRRAQSSPPRSGLYRGSTQGETHRAAGATPTQDHGPEEALRPSQGLNGLPHGLRGQRPLTGLCYRSQEEEMTWDDGAGIDAGCWSERRIPPPRP